MIFRDTDCGAVPILAEGKPVAILTDRDVVLAIGEFPDVVKRPVSDIMRPGVVSVRPGDSVVEVCDALRAQSIRRVLVVDSNSQVLGIIGWADVAPVLSDRMMGQVVKDVVSRVSQPALAHPRASSSSTRSAISSEQPHEKVTPEPPWP